MLFSALKKVFKRPSYIIFGVAVSVLVFLFFVLLPNLGLTLQILKSPDIGLVYKFGFIFSLVRGLPVSTYALTIFNIIGLAVLFGVNTPMLVYMIRRNKDAQKANLAKTTSTGIGGTVLGALGVGCAACGSFILTPLLAFFGATGILAVLPFGGGEFGILGIALMAISVYMLAKKINDPNVCPVV